MDEYPDPDDEYELLHQDELDMMRELEEEIEVPDNVKTQSSRSSLNFDIASEESGTIHNDVSQKDSAPIVSHIENKKSISKRILSCDDLSDLDLDLQLLEPPTKRHKVNDSFISRPSKSHVCGVTSLRVPKWAFIPISTDTGLRLYVQLKSESHLEQDLSKHLSSKRYGYSLLGESYNRLKTIAERTLKENNNKKSVEAAAAVQNERVVAESADLWVEQYRPRTYVELLSDEGVNRTLLKWLKLWDKVVFNRELRVISKTEERKKDEKASKFQKKTMNYTELDEDGRPLQKIALLCGPPGLGKTTLAHVIAAIAGYNVIEVNASDDRSTEVFHTKLEAATKMQCVMGNNKPNCLILDEIDGAPTASIDYLLKYINGKVSEKSKKGKKEKTKGVIKRPVICICNEPYVPSLRQLRQQAYVVHFPNTSSSKLAQRLLDICRKQHIRTDMSALTLLCEKAQSDIRSCISTLYFFKNKNGQTFKVSDVSNSDVGLKDMQKGLFSLWQEIFQVPLKKEKIFSNSPMNKALEEKAMSEYNYNPKNMERLNNVVRTMHSAGDHDRLMQGVYENFPKMRFPRSKEAILSGLEWFCWADLIDTQIKKEQSFVLLPYLPYSFAAWHFLYSTSSYSKISYPNTGYENHMKSVRRNQILSDLLRGLSPRVRAHIHSQQLLLDVLPLFSTILVPALRPVNTKLFNEREKKELEHLMDVMIDYNLNYVQQRALDGTYNYQFDPNIDELIRFDLTDKNKTATFSYGMKQFIAREVELEKVRRTEVVRTEINEKANQKPSQVEMAKVTPNKPMPNHLQKLTPKQIKVDPGESAQYKDFFGRLVKVDRAAMAKKASLVADNVVKSKVWFCYKEGFNNAVKKDVTISDIL